MKTLKLTFIQAIFLFLFSLPSLAEVNLPDNREGIWEVTIATDGNTERAQNICFGKDSFNKYIKIHTIPRGMKGISCEDASFNKDGASHISNIDCSVNQYYLKNKIVVDGDFKTKNSINLTSKSNLPQITSKTKTRNISLKYIKPCAKKHKPGDMIIGGGMTMNIFNMRNALEETLRTGNNADIKEIMKQSIKNMPKELRGRMPKELLEQMP